VLELWLVVLLPVADDAAAPEFWEMVLADPEAEGMIEWVDVEPVDAAAAFDAEEETEDVSNVLALTEVAALDNPAVFVPET
jgi:hypothetical protein